MFRELTVSLKHTKHYSESKIQQQQVFRATQRLQQLLHYHWRLPLCRRKHSPFLITQKEMNVSYSIALSSQAGDRSRSIRRWRVAGRALSSDPTTPSQKSQRCNGYTIEQNAEQFWQKLLLCVEEKFEADYGLDLPIKYMLRAILGHKFTLVCRSGVGYNFWLIVAHCAGISVSVY